MTVFVLAVLWLIVVVPMLVRRGDERRRDRSVDGFGRTMRALGRRPESADSRPQVFVPRERRAAAVATAERARRPVPAAQEALMYPVDRSEMSEARMQMMRRRRRSLGTLGGGTLLFVVLALAVGGIMWLAAVAFLAGLAGYLYFLRSQALRDRERRMSRLQRAGLRRDEGYEVTEVAERIEHAPESVVRIDDDDIELQSMDTMDLTGLYVEDEGQAEAVSERRAS
jgi:membrane protein implicated in regulation of membrane protease activity